jgi:hypothetical protein
VVAARLLATAIRGVEAADNLTAEEEAGFMVLADLCRGVYRLDTAILTEKK